MEEVENDVMEEETWYGECVEGAEGRVSVGAVRVFCLDCECDRPGVFARVWFHFLSLASRDEFAVPFPGVTCLARACVSVCGGDHWR